MERRYVSFFAIALAIVITSQLLQAWLYPPQEPAADAVPAEIAARDRGDAEAGKAAPADEEPEPAADAAEAGEAAPRRRFSLGSLDPADPATARRFELFVHGVELANGWEEETSREVLEERIAAANRAREASGRDALPTPHRLLEAHGPRMPEGVGGALGFERLVMLAAGADSLDAVRAFPRGMA